MKRRPRFWLSAWLPLLVGLALHAATSRAQVKDVSAPVVLSPVDGNSEGFIWESASDSLQRLPNEITELYRVLNAAGQLPLTTSIDPEGRSVEKLLRTRRALYGPFFPKELDNLLCAKNPHVCKPSEGDAAPRWTNGAGDMLTMPAIVFAENRRPMRFPKLSTQPMRDVVAARQGCERYDADCEEYVAYLNGVRVQELDGLSGDILVPTLSIRTTLPANLPVDVRRQLTRNLSGPAKFRPQMSAGAQVHGAQDDLEAEEPYFARQREVFELIQHPLAHHKRPPDASAVTVGVIDNGFSLDDHCDFRKDPAGAPDISSGQPPLLEHGTHVAGIIAARRNGCGLVGMSPTARLVLLPFFPQEIGNTVGLGDAITNLVRTERPSVVNVSFDYKPLSSALVDKIEEAIKASPPVLFVAAAGNQHQDKTMVCDVRPACFDYRNVISVAALDRGKDQPQLWREPLNDEEGSNWGARVHIAAPGQAIISTLSKNRVGAMSGTSQAAPMVSAAAALLFASDTNLTALEVKRRLIATSDLLPSLDNLMVGGRLNVRRALDDVRHDIVDHEDGNGATRSGRGVVRRGAVDQLQYVDAEGDPRAIAIRDIYRITRRPDGFFTMIVLGDDGKALRKVAGAQLTGGSILLKDSGNQWTTIASTKIHEFIRSIPQE